MSHKVLPALPHFGGNWYSSSLESLTLTARSYEYVEYTIDPCMSIELAAKMEESHQFRRRIFLRTRVDAV